MFTDLAFTESQEELTVESGDMLVLSHKLVDLRNQLDEVKIRKSTLEEQVDATEIELLKVMRAQSVANFKTDRGVFIQSSRSFFSCKEPEKAFDFLRNVGCGHLIKETVNTNSLSSEMTKMVSSGTILLTELPDNGITSYTKEGVSVRGRKQS